MKTYTYFRFLLTVKVVTITACTPDFETNDFIAEKKEVSKLQSFANVSTADSLPDLNSQENFGGYDSAYIFSQGNYYPLTSARLTILLLGQEAEENILHFTGNYYQPEDSCGNKEAGRERHSRLVLRLTTKINPGTYNIIPIDDLFSADLLTTERELVSAGSAVGYYTLGINAPSTENYFDDASFVKSLIQVTSGRLTILQKGHEYNILVEGYNDCNIQVDLFFKGEMERDTTIFDPNFYI